MAQVFRVFKLWKADNNLEALVPQFSGDSTTIEGSGVDPQNVECDAAESGEEPRSPVFESLGDSQASDAGATLRVPQRSTVRQNSATRFMKDGLSAIRGKLRLQPRSALGASSREGDRHTEVVVYGGSAGSSVNSWGGSSASWTPPASAVPDSKYERFRSELSSSDTIRGSFKDCVSKLPSEKHTDDAARKTVRRLCELLSIEAWRVAENVFREDLSKAEAKTQKIEADLEACERGRVQALGAHLKELTALKDQIRKLPAGTTESLSISFFSPSEYLDETTNELVQRIVEEQLKTLICAAESENSLGGLNFFIRSRMKADLEAARADIVKGERNRFEEILNQQQQEHRLQVMDLEQSLANMQAELSHKNHLLLEQGQLSDEMQEMEMSRLREQVEKEQSKSQNLAERLERANAALASAQAAVASAQAPPPPEVEPAMLQPGSPEPDVLHALEGSHDSISDDQIQRMIMQVQGEARPILPGASASVLMQHAVKLSAGFDHENMATSESGVEMLSVLVRMVGQVATEIDKETSAALPQASGIHSMLIRLMSLQALAARRQGGLLFVLASLLLKVIDELFSLVQSKGSHQVKLTSVMRRLEEIRMQSRRQISACLSAAGQDFTQMERARGELKVVVKDSSEKIICPRCSGQGKIMQAGLGLESFSDLDSSVACSPYSSEESSPLPRKHNPKAPASSTTLPSYNSAPSTASTMPKSKAAPKRGPAPRTAGKAENEMHDGVNTRAATLGDIPLTPLLAKKDEIDPTTTRSATETSLPTNFKKSSHATAAQMVRKNSIDLGAFLHQPTSDVSAATGKPLSQCSSNAPLTPRTARGNTRSSTTSTTATITAPTKTKSGADKEVPPSSPQPKAANPRKSSVDLAAWSKANSVSLTKNGASRPAQISRKGSVEIGALENIRPSQIMKKPGQDAGTMGSLVENSQGHSKLEGKLGSDFLYNNGMLGEATSSRKSLSGNSAKARPLQKQYSKAEGALSVLGAQLASASPAGSPVPSDFNSN